MEPRATERIAPGEFCWVELATADKSAGLAFYSGLFGWSAAEQEMGVPGHAFTYSIVRLGERFVCSAYEILAEQRESGVVPHWLPFIAVESIDGAVRMAEDLGATSLVDPVEVFNAGRMSVLEDPGGASFALWQATGLSGFDLGDEPGSPRWFELATADPKAATEFYGALCGWSGRPAKGAPGTVLHTKDGRRLAGMTALTHGERTRWTTHFAVADCAAACKRIQGSGGSVTRAPASVAGLGRTAAVVDPHGAAFAIVEPERSA